MRKRMLWMLLGLICLTGCTNVNREKAEQDTGAIVLSDELAGADTEKKKESTREEEKTTMSENRGFVYNDFLTDYEEDLARITFSTQEKVELVDRGDKLELKNVMVYRNYYLDAGEVERAKVGDTIEIQDIPYRIDELTRVEGYGYDVQLTPELENDWENGIYTYADIYGFVSCNGGKNYAIVFCSDDVIKEQIYTGSVFLAKDAIINAYVNGEICDISVEEYVEQESYPYIGTWSFTVKEDGLISFIQNQIAG